MVVKAQNRRWQELEKSDILDTKFDSEVALGHATKTTNLTFPSSHRRILFAQLRKSSHLASDNTHFLMANIQD